MGTRLIKPLALAAKSARTAKAAAAQRPVDALFSRSRQRVLMVLFGNPRRSFYANEVIALARVGTGAVQRELAQLADADLLLVSRQGNQKHYQANPGSVVAAEIYALVHKTLTLAGVLGAALAPHADRIDMAVAHGTPEDLRDTAEADIALLVVSATLDDDTLAALLASAATALGRRIAATLLTPGEWAQQSGKPWATALQQPGQLWLLGSLEPAAVG